MESQDLRIARPEELMGVMVENQTATLRLLRTLNERVDEHSAILKEHSAILRDHSGRLENLENLMTRIVDELVEIKVILSSPRGMGFTPEADETE